MIVWPGLRRFISTVQRLFNSASFYAPLTHSLVLDRGTGSPTFTRATAATVLGYGPTANSGDSQTLLTVAANEARFVGARRISEGVWSDTFADGTPIPSSTLLGYLAEGARTNHFIQSDTPATQTSGSLGTGTYTLWVDGSGSIAVAGATATITGAGTATSSSSVTFTVTVAGTVTYTVTGSPTRAQSENGAFRSSYIPTTTTAVTRNADILTYSGGDIPNLKTLSATFKREVGVAPASAAILALDDATANNYNLMYIANASGTTFSGVRSGAGQWSQATSNTYTAGTFSTMAVSSATNDVKMAKDGVAQTQDTSATPPTVTQLCVGHQINLFQLNGNVGGIYGWTRNFSQSELNAVTA